MQEKKNTQDSMARQITHELHKAAPPGITHAAYTAMTPCRCCATARTPCQYCSAYAKVHMYMHLQVIVLMNLISYDWISPPVGARGEPGLSGDTWHTGHSLYTVGI